MRHGRLILALLAAALCLAGPPAGVAAAAGEGTGPEIFAPVRIDLGLWTLVVFLLLFFLLKKYAWGPMLGGLQRREEKIRASVEDAQKARDESQRLRDQLQAEMDRANDKVREMLEEARRDAQAATDEMVAKARADIQADRERLRREINTARDQALQQIWNQAATLATQISSKVIRRELSPDDHRRLVDEALSELGRADGGWKDRALI